MWFTIVVMISTFKLGLGLHLGIILVAMGLGFAVGFIVERLWLRIILGIGSVGVILGLGWLFGLWSI